MNFDYMDLDGDKNDRDVVESLVQGDLIGIVSETDGGIVAYAIGQAHATAIVRALNAAEGEYEAEMVYSGLAVSRSVTTDRHANARDRKLAKRRGRDMVVSNRSIFVIQEQLAKPAKKGKGKRKPTSERSA